MTGTEHRNEQGWAANLDIFIWNMENLYVCRPKNPFQKLRMLPLFTLPQFFSFLISLFLGVESRTRGVCWVLF